MKSNIFILLLSSFLIHSSFSPSMVKPRFEVEVMQDDDYVDPDNNIIELQKMPFTLRVKVYGLNGVYLNASTDPSLFELPGDKTVPEFEFISMKTMKTEAQNSDKDLILAKGYYSYLTDSKSDDGIEMHTFNRVEKGDGFYTGYLDIEKFTKREDGKTLPVTKMKEPVYLFFMGIDADGKEMGRYALKLEWR
ncbi:MAG: hypothetical protein GC180_06855 [Bacteroidetes bacterium]|nr:hypothetical protein [Bacteroidota bacterium]